MSNGRIHEGNNSFVWFGEYGFWFWMIWSSNCLLSRSFELFDAVICIVSVLDRPSGSVTVSEIS